jgi:hypothetical protein
MLSAVWDRPRTLSHRPSVLLGCEAMESLEDNLGVLMGRAIKFRDEKALGVSVTSQVS